MSIDTRELIEKAGITEDQMESWKNPAEARFLRYSISGELIPNDYEIDVEITAPALADAIVSLPYDLQVEFFRQLYFEIQEVGDSVVITNNDEKKRGARACHLKSENKRVQLLITR